MINSERYMDNDLLFNTLKFAGESAHAAYKEGHKEGYRQGFKEGVAAAKKIVDEHFPAAPTASVPSGEVK